MKLPLWWESCHSLNSHGTVRTDHSPPCVIIIYRCHFQGYSLLTSCHAYPHLYMTFTLSFSRFLEQAMLPPTEKPLLIPLTWSGSLAILFYPCAFLFKVPVSLVTTCHIGPPYPSLNQKLHAGLGCIVSFASVSLVLNTVPSKG